MIEERLLGYDIREDGDWPDALWDAKRREIFLLRRDVLRPLSVDTLVWPSVFDTGQGIGFSKAERELLHLAGVPLPTYPGPVNGLWEDTSSMQQYLHKHWAKPQSSVVIAISWLSEHSSSDPGSFGPDRGLRTLAEPDPRWKLLGFDVGDTSLLSGLSNCGYYPEEAQVLRAEWGPHINAVHLFDDPAQAFRFCDLTNKRVSEHAPFHVYGLYRVAAFA